MRTDPDFMSYTAADTMIFRALVQTRINSAFSFDRARPFSFRQDEKKMGVQIKTTRKTRGLIKP